MVTINIIAICNAPWQIIIIIKQEANGPRLAHLSEIVIADLQMLCNIFPFRSLQLMQGSSFEQFLILNKKNVFLPPKL